MVPFGRLMVSRGTGYPNAAQVNDTDALLVPLLILGVNTILGGTREQKYIKTLTSPYLVV